MSDPGSVTVWIEAARAGEHPAAERLWEEYFRRLVDLARQRLGSLPRAAADEEDVALSAFNSFFRGVQAGRFPRLDDRHDLWQVLVVLTARKAWRRVRYESRDKRDWRRTEPVEDLEDANVAEIIGREPTPEFAAEVADECRRLLDSLNDPDLRAVAVAKMEGYTNGEIAAQLQVVERTVERRLGIIRSAWERWGVS
jgi:DNA-directed RNA polymerase specialized sigma24 family protein